jgi:hypothetical protein
MYCRANVRARTIRFIYTTKNWRDITHSDETKKQCIDLVSAFEWFMACRARSCIRVGWKIRLDMKAISFGHEIGTVSNNIIQ